MNNTLKINDSAEQIAAALLKVEAVKLSPENPFTWSSGWKSPIYCDNRVTLSYPELRTQIKQQLSEIVKEHFSVADAIAGVATAGIPQGALIADQLNLPYLYVRSKPKGHGMENLIEGRIVPGSKVVLVEDLISTGGSALKAAEALQKSGVEVLGIIAIFTYGFPQATENFERAGLKGVALSSYEHLINIALERGIIKEEQLAILKSWRNDPENWLK
ncbi:MAG: orotate phosphoribosyltransferase [Candidatus Cyclobacteriaceae bacterium M2_1C_046]